MKRKSLIFLVIVTVISLTACTQKLPDPKVSPTSPSSSTTTNSTSRPQAVASSSAIPTFAPTNDEDVKAMDKMMDQVNLNEYSNDSLKDLQ